MEGCTLAAVVLLEPPAPEVVLCTTSRILLMFLVVVTVIAIEIRRSRSSMRICIMAAVLSLVGYVGGLCGGGIIGDPRMELLYVHLQITIGCQFDSILHLDDRCWWLSN